MAPTLPVPDENAKAHSDNLINEISGEIAAKGPITLARYMQLALYAPGLGYYSAGPHKFGEQGDFVTAPEISPLFSRCIASQCQQVIEQLGGGDILELGAGSGKMALELMRELERRDALPDRYYILEVSPQLRDCQERLFKQEMPAFLQRVYWLTTMPLAPFRGIIIANEVMDAMPVHQFKFIDGKVKEAHVDYWRNQFHWQYLDPSCEELASRLNSYNIQFPNNYESEISLLLPAWIASLADILGHGLILLIDYGFPRHEYYHADRRQGTLMCHYRHRAHSNPLIFPGIQDITSHVDFTLVAEAAVENGLTVSGFTHQAGFLLGCGLTDLVLKLDDMQKQMDINNQVKKLTLPSEMGELFKAIALTKGINKPLRGFSMMSQLERL